MFRFTRLNVGKLKEIVLENHNTSLRQLIRESIRSILVDHFVVDTRLVPKQLNLFQKQYREQVVLRLSAISTLRVENV